MAKYHINEKGELKPCKAKGVCPFDGSSFDSEEEAFAYIEEKYTAINRHDELEKHGRKYSQFESLERGKFVQKETSIALLQKRDTLSQFFDPSEGWTEEREALHDEMIAEILDKYKNVPSEGKVIMSGGLPGSGKTTILTRFMKVDTSKYATVSSDDFKEELAKRGAIPAIEGLSSMECSTLVHEESSYLADRLLSVLSKEKRNVIYDFTCKSSEVTKRRIDSMVNAGYDSNSIQMVFADITVDIAHERAKRRYKDGLNNDSIGGRFLPREIIDKCKPQSNVHSSVNAETLIDVYENGGYNLKEPIVYDNSGSSPERTDFYKFKNGGYNNES